MSAPTIYRKTTKGNEEIKAKKGALDRRLRPLLILIDGRRSTDVITTLAAGIGLKADALKQLESAGFIEAASVTRAVSQPVLATVGDRPDSMSPATRPATLSRPTGSGEQTAPQRTRYERYSDGMQYMNETVSDALGVRALFFVLKVEKCANALDLLNLLPDFERMVAKKHGPHHAAHCRLIAAEILSE